MLKEIEAHVVYPKEGIGEILSAETIEIIKNAIGGPKDGKISTLIEIDNNPKENLKAA